METVDRLRLAAKRRAGPEPLRLRGIRPRDRFRRKASDLTRRPVPGCGIDSGPKSQD
jgi:hypothetical protein